MRPDAAADPDGRLRNEHEEPLIPNVDPAFACPIHALDQMPYKWWPASILAIYSLTWGACAMCFDVVPQGLPTLQGLLGITPLVSQSLMTMSAVGGICVAVPTGILSDRFGRIKILRFSLIGLATVNLFLMFAKNLVYLCIVSFFRGATYTMVSVCVPTYLAEMLPVANRGLVYSLVGLSWPLGTALATGAAAVFPDAKNGAEVSQRGWQSWQTVIGLASILPMVAALILFLFPESPRWLQTKGRPEEAGRVVEQLYLWNGTGAHQWPAGCGRVNCSCGQYIKARQQTQKESSDAARAVAAAEAEAAEIEQAAAADAAAAATAASPPGEGAPLTRPAPSDPVGSTDTRGMPHPRTSRACSCLPVIFDKKHWKTTVLLVMFAHLCYAWGSVGLRANAPTLFEFVKKLPKVGVAHVILAAVASDIVGTIVVALLVDRIGRRPIVLAGFFVSAVGCAALAPATPGVTGAVAAAYAFFMLGANGWVRTLGVWMIESYPTAVRNSVGGLANFTWQLAGAITPLVGGALLQPKGDQGRALGMIWLYTLFFALGLIAPIIISADTTHKPLEDMPVAEVPQFLEEESSGSGSSRSEKAV